MDIRSIGYFSEMPHGKLTNPSIKECVGKGNKDLINQICKYLESGVTLVTSPGVASDVINPERGEIGTLSALTDGTWLWPGDLAYYVRNYSIELPDEFIQSMVNNNWSVPIKIEDIDIETLTIDGGSPFDN